MLKFVWIFNGNSLRFSFALEIIHCKVNNNCLYFQMLCHLLKVKRKLWHCQKFFFFFFFSLKKLQQDTVRKMNMLVLVSPNPIKTFLKGPGHPFLISNSQVDCIITVLYRLLEEFVNHIQELQIMDERIQRKVEKLEQQCQKEAKEFAKKVQELQKSNQVYIWLRLYHIFIFLRL